MPNIKQFLKECYDAKRPKRHQNWKLLHEATNEFRWNIWMVMFPRSGGTKAFTLIKEDTCNDKCIEYTASGPYHNITDDTLSFWMDAQRDYNDD